MPLVFYLEATITEIISIFSSLDFKDAIISATKVTDSVVPPLLAIPVFLLGAKLTKGLGWEKTFYTYVLCAFSVLYFSFIVILASDYHKNAIGLIFVAFCLYNIYKYNLHKGKKQLILAFLFFCLCLLTHIGCFGALLLFVLVFTFFKIIRQRNIIRKYWKSLFVAVLALSASIILLALLDNQRFERLTTFLSSPLTFFENPVLWFLLDNQPIVHGLALMNLLVANVLSILGFVYILIRRKRFEPNEQVFALAIATSSLFLSSPLIGLDWSERFINISFVFIVIQYLFIYKIMTKKFFRVASLSFFILAIVYSFRPAILGKRPHITDEAYQELLTIKQDIPLGENSIVITRHGLEWWSGFVLDTKVGQEFSLSKSDFEKYDSVFASGSTKRK